MNDSARKVIFRQDTEEFFQRYALGERIGFGGELFRTDTLCDVCRSLAPRCPTLFFLAGFATVLKGVDKQSNKPVAVKVYSSNLYLSNNHSITGVATIGVGQISIFA